MIQVYLHHTNYISLKGDCLTSGGPNQSTIALHRTEQGPRWTLNLCFPATPRIVIENLLGVAVLGELEKQLEQYRIHEGIHTSEITRYMEVIWNSFGPEARHDVCRCA